MGANHGDTRITGMEGRTKKCSGGNKITNKKNENNGHI
jgi:hypothetical protein